MGALVGDGYIQLSANGLAAGSGMHGMAPDQLDRYRQAVASDKTGEELARIVSGIERQEIAVHGRDTLKTAPRGYPADHPRVGLLRHKGLVAWEEWPGAPLVRASAPKQHTAHMPGA